MALETTAITCKLCGVRRAKRACPAVHGDICPICCGTERETSLACPLSCEYLQEAHRRQPSLHRGQAQHSYPEVAVTEKFLREHEELLLFSVYSLVQAALRNDNVFDADVMSALAALIQTQKTLESGLVYESVAENAVALAVQRSFSASLADYAKLRVERESLSPVRNADMLAVLVFLHRIGEQNQNERPKGRMFMGLLSQMTPDTRVEPPGPSIII